MMILFELSCAIGHRFEGWFRSNDTFHEQKSAGAIVCPSCGNTDIAKAPMAPRVMRSASKDSAAERSIAAAEERIRADLKALRNHVEKTCEYVGVGFAEEARRIHYGEADARNIYGEATDRDAREMESEGIAFRKIPWFPRRND